MDIRIRFHPRDVARVTGPGIEKAVVAALRKAGRDGLRALRADAKRAIRSRVAIRAKYIADRALPTNWSRTAKSIDDLRWWMDVSGRPVPLGEYPRRQTRRGVSVEVVRGRREVIKSAFLAQARGRVGARAGVFRRYGKKRYPMGHKLGLSAAQTMVDGQIPRDALNRGATVLTSAFRRLLPLELTKI